MSGNIKLKKSNILKRLSIPSLSEVKFKGALLNTLKEEEPDLTLNKAASHKIIMNNQKSFDTTGNHNKENKIEKDIHHLELKIEELENSNKIKEEELITINKQLKDEKIKVEKLSDIIAKKDKKIDSLKKSLDKYEKKNNKESKQNNLIKIDIINKNVEL
jgi:chromosome segregation ATPase